MRRWTYFLDGEEIGGGGSQCKAAVTVQFQVGLALTGTNGRRKRRRRSGEGWKKAPFHTIKGRSSERVFELNARDAILGIRN